MEARAEPPPRRALTCDPQGDDMVAEEQPVQSGEDLRALVEDLLVDRGVDPEAAAAIELQLALEARDDERPDLDDLAPMALQRLPVRLEVREREDAWGGVGRCRQDDEQDANRGEGSQRTVSHEDGATI